MDKNHKLELMPIKKLFFEMAIPTLLAQLVSLLYNVVDRMYVGRIEGSGSLALAGLGVSFPIILLISAFSGLIGMGGAPRAAIAMGNKDNNTAEKILGNSITMLLGLSVILFTAFYFSKDFILMAFGASAQSLPYASDYLTIYLYGTPFVMLTFGLNIFITNQGFTKISMITVIIGCVLNIILDPIFIFALNMGVKGAALATIISQGVSAFFVIGFLLSKKSTLKVRLKNLKLSKVLVGSILSLGVSPFLMQSTECLIQLIFNTGMQKYGNDNYVALMSIFFSVTQILLMPMQGLTQGVSPIISYNYGAKNMARVRETFNLLFTVCISLSAISVVFAEIFPGVLIGLFTSDASLIALGIKPLRIFVFGMAIFGAQSACQQTFLALGQAKVSMFLAALRKIILLTPLALLLPLIPKLGIWGLFIAEPVSDILATTTTIIMFIFMSKKLGFRKEKIK
ncbi:MAG: MATE family efflux transporter [Oscillospiraceae bacterium]